MNQSVSVSVYLAGDQSLEVTVSSPTREPRAMLDAAAAAVAAALDDNPNVYTLTDAEPTGYTAAAPAPPRCGARHPTGSVPACQRNQGHDGRHGYGGVFWDDPPPQVADPGGY